MTGAYNVSSLLSVCAGRGYLDITQDAYMQNFIKKYQISAPQGPKNPFKGKTLWSKAKQVTAWIREPTLPEAFLYGRYKTMGSAKSAITRAKKKWDRSVIVTLRNDMTGKTESFKT